GGGRAGGEDVVDEQDRASAHGRGIADRERGADVAGSRAAPERELVRRRDGARERVDAEALARQARGACQERGLVEAPTREARAVQRHGHDDVIAFAVPLPVRGEESGEARAGHVVAVELPARDERARETTLDVEEAGPRASERRRCAAADATERRHARLAAATAGGVDPGELGDAAAAQAAGRCPAQLPQAARAAR